MYEVDTIISKSEIYSGEKIADLFDNVLRLTFKTEDEYIKFMENPKLTLEDFNIVRGLTEKSDIIKFLKDYDLANGLKNSKPMIEITNPKDLPVKLLKSKKRIALNLSNLNFEEAFSIITNPLVSDNVTFYSRYDEGRETTLKEMIDVYNELLSYAKPAIDNNYSPAESIYYIYNVVKKRIYNEETKEEKYCKSRSVTDILNGDKIVCTGFSNLIAAIANILHIPVEVSYWDDIADKTAGHSANVVYLNDPKYDICGVYAIDATWDSRENEEDTEYENNIEHFLIPMAIEEKSKKRCALKPTIGCSYYRFFISKIYYKQTPFLTQNKDIAFKKAEQIYNYLNLPMQKNLEDIEEELKKIGNKIILPSTLEKIITAVTPKSEEDLEKTINSSIHKKAYEKIKINTLLRIIKGQSKN